MSAVANLITPFSKSQSMDKVDVVEMGIVLMPFVQISVDSLFTLL